jgi:hypothetical protein
LIVANLLDLEWRGTKEIGSGLEIPTITVGRELEDLAMIKAVSRELDSDDSEEVRQMTPYRWRLRDVVARGLESSGLREVIKAC